MVNFSSARLTRARVETPRGGKARSVHFTTMLVNGAT